MRGGISTWSGDPLPVTEVTSSLTQALVPFDVNPPDGRPVITQSGTYVGTAASGTSSLAVNYPRAFPNGVLAVIATVDNANGAAEVQLWQQFCSLAAFTVVVRTSGGGSLAGSGVRLSYIAKGW